MLEQDQIIENRIAFLRNQFKTIQTDFRTNLKPKLLSYNFRALTKSSLEEIQRDVNHFLDRNDLKISVYVAIQNQKLVIMGATLTDNLVWEGIQ